MRIGMGGHGKVARNAGNSGRHATTDSTPRIPSIGLDIKGTGGDPEAQIMSTKRAREKAFLDTLDLVYHDYHQHKAADTLRNVRLQVTSDGRHTHLGHEIDLVLGYKEITPLDLTLVLGYFTPGKALPFTATYSVFFRFNVQVEF
jgi:hypothetical protein